MQEICLEENCIKNINEENMNYLKNKKIEDVKYDLIWDVIFFILSLIGGFIETKLRTRRKNHE